MKILMVAPTSFFSDYGGHIRILEETLALQALGHNVSIVTYYKGNDVPGIDIRRTRALPYHAEYEVGSSRHKLAFDVFLAAKVLEVGLRMRPDVIHGHMHEGVLIGKLLATLLGKPVIFDFQGGLTGEMIDHGFLDPDGRLYPWVRRLERFICRLPSAVLTSTHQARDLLSNHFGVRPDIIHPLPDCVDVTRFDPDRFPAEEKEQLRERLGIPPGRSIVVYLGLLADYQGTGDLLEAASHLKRVGKDVHLLIMGYPRVEHYRSMARSLGVADVVTLTGKVRYVDAPYYLSLGQVAVSPKVSSTEGSGKVLNYMAMSQPVVAYDTGVHREFLGDLGVFVTPGDTRALAEAIAGLTCDLDGCRELGRRLRNRAIEHYSWQRSGVKIANLYRGLTQIP